MRRLNWPIVWSDNIAFDYSFWYVVMNLILYICYYSVCWYLTLIFFAFSQLFETLILQICRIRIYTEKSWSRSSLRSGSILILYSGSWSWSRLDPNLDPDPESWSWSRILILIPHLDPDPESWSWSLILILIQTWSWSWSLDQTLISGSILILILIQNTWIGP